MGRLGSPYRPDIPLEAALIAAAAVPGKRDRAAAPGAGLPPTGPYAGRAAAAAGPVRKVKTCSAHA